MGKKKWLSIFLIVTLSIPFSFPLFEVKAETEWQKVQRQIMEIQQEKKDAAERAKKIDREISNITKEQATIKNELSQIDSDIDLTEQRQFALEAEIEKVTTEAKDAADQLALAEERVLNRDQLLKTRVRLMYRKGDVQYLEVLLGSKSFTDFLQRFSALQKIVESDKKILQSNLDDKAMIEHQKEEIDAALKNLETLYAQVETIKATLVAKREDRQVKIASLEEKVVEFQDIKEEEEELIVELATKESKLQKKKYNLQYNGGIFAWPVPESKRITSQYGTRTDPITGEPKTHNGLDIGHAPNKDSLFGADIVAAADGVVIVAQYSGGYGNLIIIDHGSDIWTYYAHIRSGGILVKVGERVKRGQKIAEVGSTGRSTGAHLHFEVRKGGKPANPWDYLKTE